ncbi:MAG: hypothetical protein AB7O24_15080 [Kofleriaceae bacterium]
MRTLSSFLSAALFTTVAAFGAMAPACMVGSAPDSSKPVYVDSDGDGVGDGIDNNGDGNADLELGSCPTCIPGADVCLDFLVDEDGDGVIEGFDLDCDGNIDIPLDLPDLPGGGGGGGGGSGSGGGGGTGGGGGGGGGTTQSSCNSAQSINGDTQSISCESTGGDATCTCNDNGTTTTCTDTTPEDCSFGSGSNCCGF